MAMTLEQVRDALREKGSVWQNAESATFAAMADAIDAHLTQPAQAVDVGADFGAMNRALCDFAMRWEIDGDYMRCLKCKRPQITNYASHDFPHAHGCKAAGNVEARPWETFAQLLSPLTRAISVQKAGPVGDERSDVWVVQDENGQPVHCASWPEACREHINDAINEHGIEEARAWKVLHFTNGAAR